MVLLMEWESYVGRLRHKVRDGIHGLIEFNNLEKSLIDSAPFQRLRSIHQLATCYQVYPGATHKRFEHSLGVMSVADRIYGSLFDREIFDDVRSRIAEEISEDQKGYWRRVVRIAALLHDLGHLPFSHAAEKELLSTGWNHERITAEFIRHSEVADHLRGDRPPIEPEDVVDLAWDPRKRAALEPNYNLSPWKTLLNEIITGDTFGADRIDYLLRDSWHAGVEYGRFDAHRLLGGLCVVIHPENDEVALGLDIGGIHSAEALLLARYFMYKQVYFHDVRRVYDLHLKDFLKAWLESGHFPYDWKELIKFTDHRVLADLWAASSDSSHSLHGLAQRLVARQHFRTVYELLSTHKKKCPTVFQDLLDLVKKEFGEENVRSDIYPPKKETNNFPVVTADGGVVSSLRVSDVIANIPAIEFGFIFVAPEIKAEAKRKIDDHLRRVLKNRRPSSRKEKGSSDGI
jgi:HD superfamily phosphohydrolase